MDFFTNAVREAAREGGGGGGQVNSNPISKPEPKKRGFTDYGKQLTELKREKERERERK
jgi:hypothetical protein